MNDRQTRSLRARFLRALPVPVAAVVGCYGSVAITDPPLGQPAKYRASE